MDDWKLRARSVVKLERTSNTYVSLSRLALMKIFYRIVFSCKKIRKF